MPAQDPSPPAVSTPAQEPPSHPRWGHAREFDRDPLQYVHWLARTYGDIVPLRLPPYRVVVFNHPALIEAVLLTHQRAFGKGTLVHRLGAVVGHGLLTSDDALWRRQRRLIQPAFSPAPIAHAGAQMAAHAARLIATWQDGQVRDIQHDMQRLTLGLICGTVFGVDVDAEAGTIGQAFDVALAAVGGRAPAPLGVGASVAALPGRVRFWWARRRLYALVTQLVRARRPHGAPGDLVARLLAARDEAGRPLTKRQVRDEVLTIVLAGHETTTVSLTWAWYLLAQHPAVEAALHAEIDRVLGDRLPEVDDLPRLVYTDQVVREVLRLYPPIWALAREAHQDLEFGGVRLRQGDVALCSPWAMHRDARYFARPEVFAPERWADGLERRLPRFAYFPFSGGPRQCLGQAFARMEMTLVLATIARRFRLALGAAPPSTPRAGVTVRPVPTVRLVPHRR
ncbi:MAG: cytochrome P450 [Candidatus Tectimicrobiota bacterium]